VAPHLVDGAGRRVLALGLANGQVLVEWPSSQRAKPENEHRPFFSASGWALL
jgi:hypothetical protein